MLVLRTCIAAIDWFEPIDEYCERHGTGFWAEPWNAWSNAAMLIAAALLIAPIRRSALAARAPDTDDELDQIPTGPVWQLWLLNTLLACVAVGSFLFHTFANRWSEVVDVGFIFLWILWFIWLYQRRRLCWSRPAAALGIVGLTIASTLVVPLCGRYVCSYGPTLGVAATLGITGVIRGRRGSRALLAATGLLILALTATLLDEPLCEYIPIGTHWLWHTINAGTFYFATKSLLPRAPTDLKPTPTPMAG